MKEQQLLDSFPDYLGYVWNILALPKPTIRQFEMADCMQHAPLRVIIMAFRGVGKSWICSTFVTWKLKKESNEKILVTSASGPRANEFSTFTRDLFEVVPILRPLRPKRTQRDSKIAFDVATAGPSHSPSIKSVGIMGQTTGSRATLAIGDDNEIPNNSSTEEKRIKLLRATTEFESIIMPGGQIMLLGTPQTEESIYFELANRNYKIIKTPAQVPNRSEAYKIHKDYLAPSIQKLSDVGSFDDEPTDPERFPIEDLMLRRASMGESAYRLQFLLDVSLSDANKYPLKQKDLLVLQVNNKAPMDMIWSTAKEYKLDYENKGFQGDALYRPWRVEDEWKEFEKTIVCVDPSGRGKDETAILVLSALNGYIYLRDIYGTVDTGYDSKVIDVIHRFVKDYAADALVIEDNFGDGMYTQLVRGHMRERNWEVAIHEIHVKQQKERRIIATVEPVMNQHRLVFTPHAIEQNNKQMEAYALGTVGGEKAVKYDLIYQLTHLTSEPKALSHDDRLDCLSTAVKFLQVFMGNTPKSGLDSLANKTNEEILAELDKILGMDKLHTASDIAKYKNIFSP